VNLKNARCNNRDNKDNKDTFSRYLTFLERATALLHLRIINIKTVTFTSTRFGYRKIKCRVVIYAQRPGINDKGMHKIAIHNSKK
jgi:hypothetical protein